MPFRTKLSKSESQIASWVCKTPGRIYSRNDLAEHFSKARIEGFLAKHTKLDEFIDFLVLRRHLLSIQLKSEQYEKTITRYCVGRPSPFALAASLRKNGYFSHGTAAYLLGLIKRPPAAIFLNVEQSAKKPAISASLSQPAIDRAFASKQRQSNLSYENGELIVTILAGKNTGRAGVEPLTSSEARGIATTNLERTLIDITVRPTYAGGIDVVLDAYRTARERVSAQMLVSTLNTLNYTYPYPQAIGFLMQRAGYSSEALESMKSRVSDFKFYLTHGQKDPEYDHEWRLFYPPDL
jgi:predicted transcriptional regulator of viral defense system